MSGPNGETCEDCIYWDGVADGLRRRFEVTHKQCRRMPPVMDPVPYKGEAQWHPGAWPCTPSGAWCGEFKSRDPGGLRVVK